MKTLEACSVEVPLTDAIMFGPEELWFQIDIRKTPFPVGTRRNNQAFF